MLGTVPTQKRVVLERFFDESGGMQLVVHAPFGSKINRAWGLALRKKFCVGFGFELQAAANEEAIVLSLGPQHSFPLEEVFDYLHPATARDVLIQALLASPLFETRWRWNAQRSLLLERSRGGKKVPPYLLRRCAPTTFWLPRFRRSSPARRRCPAARSRSRWTIPIVAQTIEDCLTEAMDVDGFLEVLRGLKDGSIERRAVDTVEPSAFARGILSAQPYTFLDDAPLEERRTQAVFSRRVLDTRTSDDFGALDPAAIERVREEAWPQPSNAEEVHEALLWMGYVSAEEGVPWQAWLDELARGRRGRARRRPLVRVRGLSRTEGCPPRATGGARPDFRRSGDEATLRELESEGVVLRTRIDGREAWCDRRLWRASIATRSTACARRSSR